jgi:hypothetical protein
VLEPFFHPPASALCNGWEGREGKKMVWGESGRQSPY